MIERLRGLRPLLPGAVTACVLAAAVLLAQLVPSPVFDYKPFVMTIEAWNIARIGYSDGRTVAGTETYRVEYRRYDDWKMTLIGDDLSVSAVGQGWRCDSGLFSTFDSQGKMTARSNDPSNCNGIGRWIHWGIASWCPWQREVVDGQAICSDGSERIVVDLRTGLPVLYEAGRSRGSVGERMVFRVERYGP